jgi:hypothetical protein
MDMIRKILLALALGALGLLAISCHKDNDIDEPEKPADFRDIYIGKYQVKETINCYGPCGTCYSLRDTVISVNYGLTDSTLSVLGRDVYLDSNGFYSAYHYGLRFWDDSISSNFMNGGLGCGRYESYKGYRFSNVP